MNLHSWTGLAAARLAIGSKEVKFDRRHRIASAMVGVLLAALIAVVLLILLSSD